MQQACKAWRVDGVEFSCDFESGNLASAERHTDGAFDLRIAKDCAGTPNERKSSTWFYFKAKDVRDESDVNANRNRRRIK